MKKNEVQGIAGNGKKSLKEAAFCIGVHWRTVYRWTLEGTIEYIQPRNNSKIFIPESEFERRHGL